MAISVSILNTSDPVCDAFISQRPDAKICHLPAWGVMVERAVGRKQFYLVARDSDKVCGVLPLTHIRSFLFGNRMVSQGVSNYGGILADCLEARDALFEFSVELAKRLNCESIEFRNIEPLPYNLHLREDKITMLIPLEGGADQVWDNLRPEIRKQTRKAEKEGLTAVDGSMELLNDFYDIYSRKMHELGTPAYPRILMAAMLQTFPENVRLFAVRLGNVTVGAGLMTFFNGVAEIPWSATLDKYNHFYPNRLLYWTIIKYYCDKGAKIFDFGRSGVDSGNYEFKRRWRAEPVRLYYQYWVHPAHQFSIVSPGNPKFKKKVEMWKRLPLWAANLLSPYISRNLV
ncbi:MAG: FemAB family XrtA/PEP-CTERM system-associated protein [Sedimentisphaerales bacterium]